MKYRTKQKRLVAVFDAYCAKFHKRHGVTLDEVSRWAVSAGLYPVPTIRDSEAISLEWERRLEATIERIEGKR